MAFVDQQDLADERGDHLRRQAARLLDRNALGQRIAGARERGAVQPVIHGREELGLYADHLDRARRRRRDGGDP